MFCSCTASHLRVLLPLALRWGLLFKNLPLSQGLAFLQGLFYHNLLARFPHPYCKGCCLYDKGSPGVCIPRHCSCPYDKGSASASFLARDVAFCTLAFSNTASPFSFLLFWAWALSSWLALSCFLLLPFCLFHSKFPHPSTQPYCKVFLSLLQGSLSLVARVCVALLARVFCPLSHGLSLKLILDQ